MELFRTNDFYIFVKGEYSLWWDRLTGAFIPKMGWNLADADDPMCLGLCDGIIGKVEHPSLFDARLLIIKESLPVGNLHGDNVVYKIKSVAFLPLGQENVDLNLQQCHKHKSMIFNTNIKTTNINSILSNIPKHSAFTKTWGTLKNAGNTIKNTTQQAAAMATGTPRKKDFKDRERLERQIAEEFLKIFTDTDSFYFSHTTDLTNSLQRLCNLEKTNAINEKALWRTVDDRFFWNRYMLKDLIELDNSMCDPWVMPIIQGYIQIEDCKVDLPYDFQTNEKSYEIFTLCLLSRRSRFRAGTRYKRRGVNDNGECANYVETEQLISYQSHEVSFVQVRGSVPVYWSQPGYKYRPPPRIDKGEAETKQAFEKHFNEEIQKYGPVCAINLIDQTGKEKVIFDAYSNHVLQFNSAFITYVTFDFHEYCRGMHFENVSILVNALSDVIKDMNYCWRDKQGHICSQNGIFRVNCIDCLDRTNVVQSALGKTVMEMQFCKLGLISPEGSIPSSIKSTFQLLWANNGDTISKQYAGTSALKGDYTRTGERKFTGIMKDGMNSANRYYLSRFKDSKRQGTIDLMLGNVVSEDIFCDSKAQQFEEDSMATAEHVKLLIEDCKKMLINQPETVLGAWGLIDADPTTGDSTETEMDSILILTKHSYFVADYDDQVDKVTNYQEVLLKDVTLLEFGTSEVSTSLFRTSKPSFCVRINYQLDDEHYHHMFRSTNLRFFNNMAVIIKNEEEEVESLKAICDAFVVAFDVSGLDPVPYKSGGALQMSKSNRAFVRNRSRNIYLDFPYMSRNVSESQLLSLKNVGTKAISNMTQQFSKLNKIGSELKKSRLTKRAKFTIGGKKTDSSSESESDCENSIFQPNIATGILVDSPPEKIEQGVEVLEDLLHQDGKLVDAGMPDHFLPSVGIVMGNANEIEGALDSMQPLPSTSQVNTVQLSSIMQNVSLQNPTPEIQINSEACKRQQQPPNMLKLDKKLSHSSGEVDDPSEMQQCKSLEQRLEKRSNSDYDVTLNISQSQSESALKSKVTNISSPVATVTKDLVLSPFSKLAKGVQNLSANLDPRKLSTSGQVRHVTEKEMEEHRQLQEKWQHSKTRLISL